MNLVSSLKHTQLGFTRKLLVALGYGVVILIAYYSSVYFFNYPYSREPAIYIPFYEYIVSQAYGEEVMYRLFPLMAVIAIFGVNWFVLIPVIAGASLYFAMRHSGLDSLLPIGVPAVILSIAFLSFGGYRKLYFQGLLWAGFIHTFANFSIFVFVPLIFFN